MDARGRVVGTQSGLMTPPGGPSGVAFVNLPEAALRLVRKILTPDSPEPVDLTLMTVRLEDPPAGPAKR